MYVLVLVSGVVDPRKPLPRSPDLAGLLEARRMHPLLSPFDEAALELALKLRDADPSVQVSALLASCGAQDPLLRTVAGHRLARTLALDVEAFPVWDGWAVAVALGEAVAALTPQPDLCLIGREFGDFDDGTVPVAFAHRMGVWYASQTVGVAALPDGWAITRQHGGRIQRVQAPTGSVAGVTNDASNRLRHPLLKNVMAARQARFDPMTPRTPEAATLQAGEVRDATPPPRTDPCEMIGGSPREQATALLQRLRAWMT